MDENGHALARFLISAANYCCNLDSYQIEWKCYDKDAWYAEQNLENLFHNIHTHVHAAGLDLQPFINAVESDSRIVERFLREEFRRRRFLQYDTAPVPIDLFPAYFDFGDRRPYYASAKGFDRKLMEYFRLHPERLYSMEPGHFEELVAEIWDSLGFEVELTKQTRDGGRDIIAISTSPIKHKLLIECKRFAKERRVGIEIVDRLGGVVHREGANHGLIVTTSTFSRPAQNALDSTWYLDGVDHNGLMSWIVEYEEARFCDELGLPRNRDITI